ncbi:hypothetical protein C0Z20_18250 [Trinickia symbiotica]|uniref:Uncharacterized protein n=1 Tax=Trinickia symbiotica TaxID=863227 RepID=A0A2N7X1D4_9BURK|nr:hypothetical protein C0Z20_18250 [Trinickia symbiotica]
MCPRIEPILQCFTSAGIRRIAVFRLISVEGADMTAEQKNEVVLCGLAASGQRETYRYSSMLHFQCLAQAHELLRNKAQRSIVITIKVLYL